MARSIFTITAASETAKPDAKGHAEIPLTVTNISGRSLRGRAKVVPQDPAQSGWFKIAGNAERDFAASGTQQFTVQVDVPPDAKPRKCAFRLDAVSTELPDEEYTQGPSINVPLAGGAPAAKPKMPLWLIPLLAVVLLLVLGGGGFLVYEACCTASYVTIPKLAGSTHADAEKALLAVGLSVASPDQTIATSDQKPGLVVKSDPAEGQQVAAGSQVTLFIAQATTPQKIPVPAVARTSPEQATKILTDKGLTVKPAPYPTSPSPDVPAGSVLRTIPDVGTEVVPGTAITLVIAATPPPQKVAVPAVARQTPAQAIQAITAAGLTVRPPPYKQVPSPDIPEGTVVQTDPDVGTQLAPGTAVALIIAMKPVPPVVVPPVAGLTPPDAVKALVEAGLQAKPGPYASEPSAAQEPGRVLRTDPPIGQQVPAKTLVTIVLAAAQKVALPVFQKPVPVEAVIAKLLAMGLDVKLMTTGSGPVQPILVKTDPPEGSQVNEGSTVTVLTYGALIPLTDLKGMNQQQVDSALHNLLHWP